MPTLNNKSYFWCSPFSEAQSPHTHAQRTHTHFCIWLSSSHKVWSQSASLQVVQRSFCVCESWLNVASCPFPRTSSFGPISFNYCHVCPKKANNHSCDSDGTHLYSVVLSRKTVLTAVFFKAALHMPCIWHWWLIPALIFQKQMIALRSGSILCLFSCIFHGMSPG